MVAENWRLQQQQQQQMSKRHSWEMDFPTALNNNNALPLNGTNSSSTAAVAPAHTVPNSTSAAGGLGGKHQLFS